MAIKRCIKCGTSFSSRKYQRTCDKCKTGVDKYTGILERGIEKLCDVCGKTFKSSHKDTKCCSSQCRTKRYQNRKGFGMTYETWEWLREYVLERDDYTCQDCKTFYMDIGLCAHHLKPLKRGGVNEPGNLVTLCDKCHQGRHGVLFSSIDALQSKSRAVTGPNRGLHPSENASVGQKPISNIYSGGTP